MSDSDNDDKQPRMKLPIRREPRCHACNSRLRDLIDRMAVMGYRATYIAKHVQEVEPELSRKSIERHIDRHLDFEQEALRQLLEEGAQQMGDLTDETKRRIVTRSAYLDRMIEKGWDQIVREDSYVKQQDVLKAVELKTNMDATLAAQQQDQLMRQQTAILQAVKEIVPADVWPALAARAQEIYDGEGPGPLALPTASG